MYRYATLLPGNLIDQTDGISSCPKFAASRGYNIIPTTRLQKYVKSIDLRSALEDNVAFKLSFGATFMLAAFAEL